MPSLSGIIPPMVTPLRARDDLDHAGLERLIEHLIDGGVSGLFILGTTGEGPALSYRLRRELIERTCSQVNQRVPVLVCVTDTSFVESLNLAQISSDAGATAIVAAPPFYWPLSEDELCRYFDRLASEQPLPLLLYNMPALTKTPIPLEVIRRVLDNPRIIGIKDSSGKMEYLHDILKIRGQRSDWPVFVGEEGMVAEGVQAGATGGVTGGANVFPKLYARYFQAAFHADRSRIAELQALINRVGGIYRVGHGASAGIRGIKCALSVLGICDDFVSEPFARLEENDRNKIAELIEELKSAIQQALA